jgi:Tol biopolymer transport system component
MHVQQRRSLKTGPRRGHLIGGLAVGVVAVTLACLTPGLQSASAKVSGPNGQIAFFRTGGNDRGASSVFTINPDGSHEQLVQEGPDAPRWSPDGTQLAMECNGSACGTASALIVNVDTGSSRLLPSADPTLGLGCFVWSPDGTRFLCGTLDEADPSRNGMYTVRSSDGGDLTRVTRFGETPGDYSPDGTRISFVGNDRNGDLRLYVVKVTGGAPTAITPAGMSVVDDFGGSWSPAGNQILFVARPTSDSRRAIWVVNADGSGLRELPISGCGGLFADPRSIGCDGPSWSPDGTKLAFARYSAKTHVKNIYTVHPDGSDLFQVTNTGFQDFAPDWGTHPLAQ